MWLVISEWLRESVFNSLWSPPLSSPYKHLVSYNQSVGTFPVCHHLPLSWHLLIALNSSYLTRCVRRVPSPLTGYRPPVPGWLSLSLSLSLQSSAQLTSFRLNSRQCSDTSVESDCDWDNKELGVRKISSKGEPLDVEQTRREVTK